MKKHNLLKVVFISILVAVLLTWLLSTLSVQYGQVIEGTRQQVGLLDFFTYPTLTFTYFGTVFAMILAIGAFYGVLSKTGIYRKLLDKIVKGFAGREWLFLTVTMVVIAGITSVSGLNYAMMFVFPFVISVILLMGYNKLVAATTTVGSLLVGIMGTTFGTANIPYVTSSLTGVTVYSEIITKVLILIVGLILLVFNVLRYASKTRNTTDEVDSDFVPEAVTAKEKKHIWPAVVIFDLLLLVMILSFIPWADVFELELFTNITEWVTSYELFGFPIFAIIIGQVAEFGYWGLTQIPTLILMATGLLALVYRMKFNDFLKAMIDGLKKAIFPGAIVLLIYTVLIIMVYHPVQLVIAKFLLGLTESFNVVTMGAVAILSGIFNIDMTYVSQSVLPYIVTVITDTGLYPLIAVMFQSLYAFAMLFAPTSVVLMATLAYLKVPYTEWLKHIWKLLLQLLVVLFVIFTILLLI